MAIKVLNIVFPLYNLSLNKVSQLLIECQRKDPTSSLDNPFQAFHPDVVQDIISCICVKTGTDEYLKSSYLFLLLMSGRIKYFNLNDVNMHLKDAEEIFNYLQPNGEKLRSIRIRHVSCVSTPWMSSAFGTLLRSAKDLVSLETSINFKLSELSSCVNLKKLTLNFMVTDSLSSFLHVDDKISCNHSLQVLKILRIQDNPDIYLDIAEILQYCVEIVEISYDVSKSVVYLHETDRATTYKLQKTNLGECTFPLRVTEEAVEIVSLYCPDLRIVEISPEDYSAITALSNFDQIVDLTLNEPEWPDDDFGEGVRPLLETPHFGYNLKSLVLRYFSEIDFSCIGACCPNLEELRVEFISENNHLRFTPNSFQKLVSLYLENINEEPCEAVSLIGILSRATFLEFLTIKEASMLDDAVLDIILANPEAFSRVKNLNVVLCGLTVSGLKRFVQAMPSVQFISFSSHLISSEDTDRVLKDLDLTRFD